MSNWYEDQAQLSFEWELESFIKSAVGKDNIRVEVGAKKVQSSSGKWDHYGIDNVSWDNQRFSIPSTKKRKLDDVFRTAILGRYSYPRLVDTIQKALENKYSRMNEILHDIESKTRNTFTYQLPTGPFDEDSRGLIPKNAFQTLVETRKKELKLLNNVSCLFARQGYLLNQIEFVLALIRGADHYSQPDLMESVRKEILDDFYGTLGPKTEHKDGVKRRGINRKFTTTDKRYKIIQSIDEVLADAKDALDGVSQDDKLFLEDDNRFESETTHRDNRVSHRFEEAMVGAILVELIGSDTKNALAKALIKKFYKDKQGNLITTAPDIAWAMTKTCIFITKFIEDAPSSMGNADNKALETRHIPQGELKWRDADEEEKSAQVNGKRDAQLIHTRESLNESNEQDPDDVELTDVWKKISSETPDESKPICEDVKDNEELEEKIYETMRGHTINETWIDHDELNEAHYRKSIHELIYGISIADMPLDEVEEEYGNGVSVNLGGQPYKDTYNEDEVERAIEHYKRVKRMTQRVEKNPEEYTDSNAYVWKERKSSENFTQWGSRYGHYAKSTTQDFYTNNEIQIDSLEPTEGTEAIGMPTIVNTGMPMYKTWELMIGNTDVFKDQHSAEQEIVILLDHSASMMGYEATIAWSVAKTIKNTYENTEIYPYSDWGIYTGNIGHGQEVPNLKMGGTPTDEALLWVSERYYDRLERTNIILVSDDQQPDSTGHLAKYMRETMGVRLGVVCVGNTQWNTYVDFPSQFFAQVKTLEDLDKLQSIIDIVTLEG